ncbi:MAG: hypothetical protein AAGL24_20360 [Pseudomonadota bacterium]
MRVATLALAVGFALFLAVRAGAAELVMVEQTGCHWCARWDAEIGVVYAKTEQGKRAPLRRIDIHEKLPPDLSAIELGWFTPTFILVEDNREIARLRGYPGEDFFWGLLDRMIEKLPDEPGRSS